MYTELFHADLGLSFGFLKVINQAFQISDLRLFVLITLIAFQFRFQICADSFQLC